ncbi:MAG TPA: CotH kinase family protein [Chitinophagales bacterium]|nr:CotH kinase family protein [Chitinophagales bacterium]
MKKKCLLLVACLFYVGVFAPFRLFAQIVPSPYQLPATDAANILFNDTGVPRIDIFIDPADFTAMLNASTGDVEYPATFVFTNAAFSDTVQNIGFGLRGNTSLASGKKSFKVSFNSFTPGNRYKSLEKMNLNGEHNDPAIIRAKLYWDLAAHLGIPAPRANHVALYVNNQYRGLYINVEHIDEEFAARWYGNKNGNLYKCLYPASLEYLGPNANDYKLEMFGRRVYELKTNETADDYTDLAAFVTALNSPLDADFAGRVDALFNVDNFLRLLALDIFTANWDGYNYNINNYYLYQNTATGKFEYIPYDTDNTFGIDWFGIDWASRNVYGWAPEANFPPLHTRLLNVQEFRRRFSYYFNMLLQTAATTGVLFPRIDALRVMITPFAEADNFRTLDYGFTITQFTNSYEQALGGHVTYGIKPYIATRRTNALIQLTPQNIAPVILSPKHTPLYPISGQTIYFTCRVFDDNAGATPQVTFYYRINGGAFSSLTMQDNGTQADGAANDGTYGIAVSGLTAPATIEYYFTAADANAATNREPLLQNSYRQVALTLSPYPLTVNEFMATNNTIPDEFGQFDDWIEIYNAGFTPINLSNFYLTDNLSNPTKWRMPDTLIAPQGFMLIWADENGSQGPHHANFKLSAGGESIGIFTIEQQPVYTITYGQQQQNITQGLLPDGQGELQILPYPTPGYSNMTPLTVQPDAAEPFFTLHPPYPNPFTHTINAPLLLTSQAAAQITLFNSAGSIVYAQPEQVYSAGSHLATVQVPEHLPSGLYFLQICFSAPNTPASITRIGQTFKLVKY